MVDSGEICYCDKDAEFCERGQIWQCDDCPLRSKSYMDKINKIDPLVFFVFSISNKLEKNRPIPPMTAKHWEAVEHVTTMQHKFRMAKDKQRDKNDNLDKRVQGHMSAKEAARNRQKGS